MNKRIETAIAEATQDILCSGHVHASEEEIIDMLTKRIQPEFVCEGDENCARDAEFETKVKGQAATYTDGWVRLCGRCRSTAEANGILEESRPIQVSDAGRIGGEKRQAILTCPECPIGSPCLSECQFCEYIRAQAWQCNHEGPLTASQPQQERLCPECGHDPSLIDPITGRCQHKINRLYCEHQCRSFPAPSAAEPWRVASWGYENAVVTNGTTNITISDSAYQRPLSERGRPRRLARKIAAALNQSNAESPRIRREDST